MQSAIRNIGCFISIFFTIFIGLVSGQSTDSYSDVIRNGSQEQKRDALFQIINLESEAFSRTAISALTDSSEIVRATATHSIIYLPREEAADLLLPLLKDKSELVRRETAYSLGKIQNPKSIIPLIEVFQKDKISEVRNAAIFALGEIGDISAIEFLTTILQKAAKDDQDFLRRSAARSIGQIAKNLQTQRINVVTPTNFLPDKFKSTEKPNYPNITENFPAFRNVIAVLVKVLQNPKELDDTKREAAFALGEIRDKSAISVLQENLTNSDYYLSEICKEALLNINAI